MFTGKKQQSLKSAESYFADHLVYGDYYTGGLIDKTGHWVGEGCKELGLIGGEDGADDANIVGAKEFSRLCRGMHPKLMLPTIEGQQASDEKLRERKLTLRLNAKGKRVIFDDFVCSAPKSVSIMACLLDDEKLIAAHQKAADAAFAELEKFASTRVRKEGADFTRTTGKVVAAKFTHSVSRAKDPQLHTHYICMNATFDPVEGCWKALHAKQMYEATTYATEVYRNHLRRAVEQLGYQTKAIDEGKLGFEIEGVEKVILQRFSQRSKDIKEEVSNEEKRLNRPLDNTEVADIARKIRPKKDRVTPDELSAFQKGRLTSEEMAQLRALKNEAEQARNPKEESKPDTGKNRTSSVTPRLPRRVPLGAFEKLAIKYAAKHAFTRQSVVYEREILRLALRQYSGKVEIERLKKALEEKRFIRAGTRLTTPAVIAEERALLDFVNTGINGVKPLQAHYKPSADLSDDEALVMQHILQSTDRITGFRGLAGVGKTFVLGKLKDALEPRDCLFLAPTGKAVKELRARGIKNTLTLANFLKARTALISKVQGGTIVLDEAGLVGVKDMKKLATFVHENDIRLILSGDTSQHTSVARGDALRLIEEYSNYRYVNMTRIRRQRDEHYRQAVLHAAEKHPLLAWEYLEDKGWITETSCGDERVAAHYISCLSSKRQALVIAPTWREIERVTVEIREQLRANGTLKGVDQTVKVFDSLKWTPTQMGDVHSYIGKEETLRIFFQEGHGPFLQNEEVTVVRVHEDHLEVRKAGGQICTLSPSQVKDSIEVGQEAALHLTQGDQVLFRRNWNSGQKHGFTNGDFGTIRAITPFGIMLEDGRQVPKNYRSFTYGYCATSYAAQGATVDEVVISASTASFAAINLKAFYVSISRARDRCHIYTDDKEQLKEAICQSGKRTAGIELELELDVEASKQIHSSRRKSVMPHEILTNPQVHFSDHPIGLSMRKQVETVRQRPVPKAVIEDRQPPENDVSMDL